MLPLTINLHFYIHAVNKVHISCLVSSCFSRQATVQVPSVSINIQHACKMAISFSLLFRVFYI